MEETVVLNVGGSLFETKPTTLKRFPDTRLGTLGSSSDSYNTSKSWYFFDRNPFLFGYILDLYRNGELHLPADVCGAVIRQELEYWQIAPSHVSRCCLQVFFKYENNMDIIKKLERNLDTFELDYENKSSGNYMRNIWLVMDQPRSSKLAKAYNLLFLFITMVSALLFCFGSHPDFNVPFMTFEELVYLKNTTSGFDDVDLTNPKSVQSATMFPMPALDIMSTACLSFFTIDLIVHFVSCPRKFMFFRFALNILDIVLVSAMWICFSIEKNPHLFTIEAVGYVYIIFKALIVLRLFRFFRLVKHYSGMKILFMSIKESAKELFLLLVAFLIAATFFASFIYYAEYFEPTTFRHIFKAIWWAIVTMTTVGYGDMYPKSGPGYVVGSFCALFGLLILAMPIAIIVTNFSEFFIKNNERKKFKKIKAKWNKSLKVSPS